MKSLVLMLQIPWKSLVGNLQVFAHQLQQPDHFGRTVLGLHGEAEGP